MMVMMTAIPRSVKASSRPFVILPGSVQAPEFLDALAGLHFRGVEVSLPVDSDVVQRGELARLAARPPEVREDGVGGAVDDAHLAVHAVGHVDEALRAVRREHQVVHRAVAARALLENVLRHEAAVLAEHLHPVVAAVADVEQPLTREPDAVHRVRELPHRRAPPVLAPPPLPPPPPPLRPPPPL